jgi:hypothetical protein
MCNRLKGEMLMTDYALNKEKRNLVLRSPVSPGQVRSVLGGQLGIADH